MHIEEDPKTESINWKTFYEGKDFPQWGHAAWKLLHDTAENIPCSTCQPGALNAISGIHDLINIETGKSVFNHDQWMEFVQRIEKAAAKNPHLKHFREHKLESATHFDEDSFRMIHQDGDMLRIGCPVGKFHGNRCSVGTRGQAILHGV